MTAPGGLPGKYKDNTQQLFKATCEIAMIACRDKLLQIYFLGLKMLETVTTDSEGRFYGGDVTKKQAEQAFKPFIKLLIEKIGEMNYRARDISLRGLGDLLRHPAVELRHALEAIMDITEKPPGPAKAPWRALAARLEVLHMIVD